MPSSGAPILSDAGVKSTQINSKLTFSIFYALVLLFLEFNWPSGGQMMIDVALAALAG